MKALKYVLTGIACLFLVVCLPGLILPKDYTVTRSAAYGGYEIKEINFEAKQYLTKRATVKMSEIGAFFGKTIPEVFAELGKAGLQPTGAPCTMYYKWDTEKQETDMAVGVPVSAQAKIPAIKGMEPVKAEGRALKIVYRGSFEKIGSAYEAMHDYMKEKNLSMNNLTLEEYMTDPKTEPDTSKWVTNIYYFVK